MAENFVEITKIFFDFPLHLTEFSNIFCQNIKINVKEAIFLSQITWEIESKVLYFAENFCKFRQDIRKMRIICRSEGRFKRKLNFPL